MAAVRDATELMSKTSKSRTSVRYARRVPLNGMVPSFDTIAESDSLVAMWVRCWK
jgi:hypothetical protein